MFSLFIIHILSHSMVQMLYCILNFSLFYIHSRVLLLLHDTFLLIILCVAIYSFDFSNILKSAVLNCCSITIRTLCYICSFFVKYRQCEMWFVSKANVFNTVVLLKFVAYNLFIQNNFTLYILEIAYSMLSLILNGF